MCLPLPRYGVAYVVPGQDGNAELDEFKRNAASVLWAAADRAGLRGVEIDRAFEQAGLPRRLARR